METNSQWNFLRRRACSIPALCDTETAVPHMRHDKGLEVWMVLPTMWNVAIRLHEFKYSSHMGLHWRAHG